MATDPEADCDMFNDPADVFGTKFRHSEQAECSKDYILHLSTAPNCKTIAVGSADANISVLDSSTAKQIHSWSSSEKKKGDGLSGMRFSPNSDTLVYSTTFTESGPKLWDLRTGVDKPVKVFKDTSSEKLGKNCQKSIVSFDINCDDAFLAAGTAQVVEDAFLLFWDVRSEAMLGGYWDSFGMDVTSVKFHPTNPDRLATGGADGLINVFDVSQESEDDALLTALNPGVSSVRSLTWFQRKNDTEALAAISDDEELVVWPRCVEGLAGEDVRLTREDVTIGIRRKTPEWCRLVDAHPAPSGNLGLTVLAGSTFPVKPCLRLATTGAKKTIKLKSQADLKHPDTRFGYEARCSAIDTLSETVIVGDERGNVHWWTKET